jgi:hypothetical protein
LSIPDVRFPVLLPTLIRSRSQFKPETLLMIPSDLFYFLLVEEIYGTRYQSGSFSSIPVGGGRLEVVSFFWLFFSFLNSDSVFTTCVLRQRTTVTPPPTWCWWYPSWAACMSFFSPFFFCYSSTALAGGYSCVTLTLTLTLSFPPLRRSPCDFSTENMHLFPPNRSSRSCVYFLNTEQQQKFPSVKFLLSMSSLAVALLDWGPYFGKPLLVNLCRVHSSWEDQELQIRRCMIKAPNRGLQSTSKKGIKLTRSKIASHLATVFVPKKV